MILVTVVAYLYRNATVVGFEAFFMLIYVRNEARISEHLDVGFRVLEYPLADARDCSLWFSCSCGGLCSRAPVLAARAFLALAGLRE